MRTETLLKAKRILCRSICKIGSSSRGLRSQAVCRLHTKPDGRWWTRLLRDKRLQRCQTRRLRLQLADTAELLQVLLTESCRHGRHGRYGGVLWLLWAVAIHARDMLAKGTLRHKSRALRLEWLRKARLLRLHRVTGWLRLHAETCGLGLNRGRPNGLISRVGVCKGGAVHLAIVQCLLV